MRVSPVVGMTAAIAAFLSPVETLRAAPPSGVVAATMPSSSQWVVHEVIPGERLVEVAERCGTPARLIQRASEIDPAWLEGVGTVGLTAGASAPEKLVREVIERLGEWRAVDEHTLVAAEEKMIFKLPRQLID